MSRSDQLEQRLSEWGREYGGGRYENTGWQGISPLASLMKYHGKPPEGLNKRSVDLGTAADEVQAAVEALGRQEKGFIPAQVIRCEYMLPAQPVEAKRQKLRRIGCGMSDVRYWQHLRLAKIHVAAWLRIPFSPPLEPEDAEVFTN